MTTASLPQPRKWVGEWRSIDSRRRVVVFCVAVMLLLTVGFVGYIAGSGGSTVHVARGYAYASSEQISASADGWSYDIPLDVQWRSSDPTGGWHEGSRPACLPAGSARMPVKFGWVPVRTPDNVGWRTVVWVDCR